MPSIFDSVVTKENDHTNLLRNLMERHPKAAASALTYLLGKDFSDLEAASYEFHTQRSFVGADGREIPDILVEGRNFRCLIEAKIDPELSLTAGQLNGYKGCFETKGEQHLCFLVPNGWRHTGDVDHVRVSLGKMPVEVHERNWRGLVESLDRTTESLSDAILIEAVSFWKWRFEVTHMSVKEQTFLNEWSSEKYSSIRKLEKAVDQAKKLFDARGYETELETSDIDAYGFYIKRGRFYILWIGIWVKSPTPLSYAFHSTKANWRRPNPVPPSSNSTDGHHLWPLGPETWDDPERIYAQVKHFLDSQNFD